MQFKDGADVLTPAGEKVGSIKRVVLDPHTQEVTHLVIGSGFLLPSEKVIPIDWIASSNEDQIHLSANHADLEDAVDFTEIEYVPIEDQSASTPDEAGRVAPPVYWYPPVGVGWWMGGLYPGYFSYPISPYIMEIEQNIPDGTIALKEGATVISQDGEDVGNIERIYTEPSDHRVTHFLLSKGLLIHEHKLVPALWIDSIQADEVHLSVDSALLNRLPAYSG